MVAQAAWGVPGVQVGADGSLDLALDDLDPEAPLTDPDLAGEPFVTLRRFLAAVPVGPSRSSSSSPGRSPSDSPSTPPAPTPSGPSPSPGLRCGPDPPGCSPWPSGWRPAPPSGGVPRRARLRRAHAPGVPLHPEAAIDLTSGALAVLERGAVTGLHCCGATDWKLAMQSRPQILSAPLGSVSSGPSETLGRFLDDGGRIAWGAIPTDAPLGSSPGRLWRQLSGSWCELVQGGCDPVLLRLQSLVTPACGLATHGVSQAERVLGLTREVAAGCTTRPSASACRSAPESTRRWIQR
jgi:hypothetical protein